MVFTLSVSPALGGQSSTTCNAFFSAKRRSTACLWIAYVRWSTI